MAGHMYYPDLPCWCGSQPAFGSPHDVCAEAAADDPPEYGPDDGEAQRIAEVFADARAELDRGL